MKEIKKFYSLYADAIDKYGHKHVVTVGGMLTVVEEKETLTCNSQVKDKFGKVYNGVTTFEKPWVVRHFGIARAICAPMDEFDINVGEELIKKRIEKGEVVGELNSTYRTMLNDDMCNILLVNELKYAVENIDKLISKNK